MQATYILDMPLRRLTKFSRLELEKEKAELEETIAALDAILERREAAAEGGLRRARRGREDLRHAAPHHPARLGRAGRSAPPSPLEVADDPCFVYLSCSRPAGPHHRRGGAR